MPVLSCIQTDPKVFPWGLAEQKLELNQVIFGFDSTENKLLGLVFLHAICSFTLSTFKVIWSVRLGCEGTHSYLLGEMLSVIISCAPISLRVQIFLANQRYRHVPSEERLVHCFFGPHLCHGIGRP